MPNKRRSVVSFYADSLLFKNRLMSFRVNNIADAQACLFRLRKKGLIIRAAFFNQTVNGVTVSRCRIL